MNDVTRAAVFLLAAAFLAAVLLAVWMIGAQTLRTMGYIMVGAFALSAVLASSSLPIRAYRKRDTTGESHYYHDGTRTEKIHTIDGRQITAPEVKLLQLPQTAQPQVYGELLRAAWQAGHNGAQAQLPQAEETSLTAINPENAAWADWERKERLQADWDGPLTT